MNMGPIEENIINTLNKNMSVSSLKIMNESFMHNVPINSETHFKIVIVSDDFNNLSLIDRHKLVYKNLGTLINKVHAISIHSFNINEFELNPMILDSPECAHKK
tara:strand:- start:54 stop:365 length:312 start_codon:yes stop_codon:yes gene_type:complete